MVHGCRVQLAAASRWRGRLQLSCVADTISPCDRHYASTHNEAPVTFTLTTTALPRKYTLLGDLPYTALPFVWRIIEALAFPATSARPEDGDRALAANSWHRYGLTRAAFAQHPSQYTWDRHMYMIISRYVWFNDLKKVPRATAGQTQT